MSKPPDVNEQRILHNLTSLIGGLNPTGGKVSPEMQRDAENRYLALKQHQASQEAWYLKQAADEQGQQHEQGLKDRQHLLEVDKARSAVEVEHRKLDLEAERIEVAKAEVIVKALEAASRHPELAQLTDVVKEVSHRLLGGGALPAIEDKSGE